MIPLNMVSLLMLIVALATAWKSSPSSRLPLSLGLISLFIATITFPIYFAGANAEFLSQTMDLGDISEKIEIWSNWHWFRTGLAILSIVFVSWALLNRGDEVAKA
jgi:phosphoglycerol transferase MdoB-like AlkP superfamily enzyme